MGIGTSSPVFPLDVAGSVNITGTLFAPAMRVGTLYDSSSTANARIDFGGASKYIAFNTNASEKMRIDSAGNVGIGTSTPAAKLSVDITRVTGGYYDGVSIAGTQTNNVGG